MPSTESKSLTLAILQREIGGCREWLDTDADACKRPAEYVLWGKLLPPEALGPRCAKHAAFHVGWRALRDPAWALIDLVRLADELDKDES